MSTNPTRTVIPISPADLENLIRRVVREELVRLLRRPARSILEDRGQEGSEDPAEDELLLSEAFANLHQYGDQQDALMSWEDFEAELDKVEAAGELPD